MEEDNATTCEGSQNEADHAEGSSWPVPGMLRGLESAGSPVVRA
jgi:hypothetical protein